jgi:hypothetical protein
MAIGDVQTELGALDARFDASLVTFNLLDTARITIDFCYDATAFKDEMSLALVSLQDDCCTSDFLYALDSQTPHIVSNNDCKIVAGSLVPGLYGVVVQTTNNQNGLNFRMRLSATETTEAPTASPTLSTISPTLNPTNFPTLFPTFVPTMYPTISCPGDSGVQAQCSTISQAVDSVAIDVTVVETASVTVCQVCPMTPSPTTAPSAVPTVFPTNSPTDLVSNCCGRFLLEWDSDFSNSKLKRYRFDVVNTDQVVVMSSEERVSDLVDLGLHDDVNSIFSYTIDAEYVADNGGSLLEGETYTVLVYPWIKQSGGGLYLEPFTFPQEPLFCPACPSVGASLYEFGVFNCDVPAGQCTGTDGRRRVEAVPSCQTATVDGASYSFVFSATSVECDYTTTADYTVAENCSGDASNIQCSALSTAFPTFSPTGFPTHVPTVFPTFGPSQIPTPGPTAYPTLHPSGFPTLDPSGMPTMETTESPTPYPTSTFAPTKTPTTTPTFAPTISPSSGDMFVAEDCCGIVEITWDHDFNDSLLNKYVIDIYNDDVGQFPFFSLFLKISDISDFYDSNTAQYSYPVDYTDLEASSQGNFLNEAEYYVEVTPRRSGGIDLTPYTSSFSFNCNICSEGDVLPCEDTPGQCDAFVN